MLCSVFGAPREYNGEEYSGYSGRRVNTAEYVSSRALVRIPEYECPLLGQRAHVEPHVRLAPLLLQRAAEHLRNPPAGGGGLLPAERREGLLGVEAREGLVERHAKVAVGHAYRKEPGRV